VRHTKAMPSDLEASEAEPTVRSHSTSHVIQVPPGIVSDVTADEKSGSDDSPTESGSTHEPEFKEGGYGWHV
jgi:hypothetical protein